MADVLVHIDGRELTVSNLDKVLYPQAGFTKAGVIDYYAKVAPTLLPHLHRRALTLVRCPDGVEAEPFFEKRCPPSAPGWVPSGGPLDGCLAEEPATLVWLANLAALELHTHQQTIDAQHPTSVVFDLDPGPPATVVDCARVALDLRTLLDRLGLVSVVKTSGSKGLHVAVPINGTHVDDAATKGFALALGRLLAEHAPDRVTVAMAKQQRENRVFVDWSQNDANKTTVAAYSLRVTPRPTVSTPVTWDEISDALDAGDPGRLAFETEAVLARVAALGDCYAPNLTVTQEIPVLA